MTWHATGAARLVEGQYGGGSEVEIVMQYVQGLTMFSGQIPADFIRKVKGLPEKIKSQGKAKTTNSGIP